MMPAGSRASNDILHREARWLQVIAERLVSTCRDRQETSRAWCFVTRPSRRSNVCFSDDQLRRRDRRASSTAVPLIAIVRYVTQITQLTRVFVQKGKPGIISLSRIRYVLLWVTNEEASKRFYCDVLGFASPSGTQSTAACS